MKKRDLPTATEMGSIEQDIVATAMSYTAARSKALKERELDKYLPIARQELGFRELLFKHCRRLRKNLKRLAREARKRRSGK